MSGAVAISGVVAISGDGTVVVGEEGGSVGGLTRIFYQPRPTLAPSDALKAVRHLMPEATHQATHHLESPRFQDPRGWMFVAKRNKSCWSH